jgi:hypothetical protein
VKEEKKKKLTIVDKLNAVFTKQALTKDELSRDGYMLLRFLSMKPEYTDTMNKIQKYQGVLGHRLFILLQHIFAEKDRAPFLEYAKGKEKEYKSLSEKSCLILRNLFHVSKQRLEEYIPNLWVTDDEIKQIWGIQ